MSAADIPNWSAYGYTKDGFMARARGGGGRYMVGPVRRRPHHKAKPENDLGGGYMRLSGTSFTSSGRGRGGRPARSSIRPGRLIRSKAR